MPTSEFPTDVILKQTVFAVGMYVKLPELAPGVDWLGALRGRDPPRDSSFVLDFACCLVDFLFSLYSSMRLMRSAFSKQSSFLMPRASRMFLSSLMGRAVRFVGISMGPAALACAYISA